MKKDIEEYFSKLKETEKEISYDQFLKLFSLKQNQEVKQVDVKNAFRMLCKQEKDNCIHKDRIRAILEDIGIDEMETAMLIGQLD